MRDDLGYIRKLVRVSPVVQACEIPLFKDRFARVRVSPPNIGSGKFAWPRKTTQESKRAREEQST